MFVFSHSLVFGKRFSNALIKEEEFTSYQKELNESLEKLVKERTKKLEDSYEKIKLQSKELEDANINLQILSTIDSLTGLYNRRQFDKILDLEWRRALREKNPISLIFIDIDYFKSFNDIFGHQAGDNCLSKLANVLNNSMKRTGDFVARYGGEEFVVILPSTNKEEALRIAKHIKEQIESLKIEHPGSSISKYVTASLGASSVIPGENISSEELINEADRALYMAKNEGRNKIKIFQNF